MRTGSEEELVSPAIVCRSSAELNPPELVDGDFLPFASLTVPTNWPRQRLKALMVPLLVLFETSRVLLSLSKIRGRHGNAPGLVQEARPASALPHQLPIFPENVDEAARPL